MAQQDNYFQQMAQQMQAQTQRYEEMIQQMALRIAHLEQAAQQAPPAVAPVAAAAAAAAAGPADANAPREPRVHMQVKFDPPKFTDNIVEDPTGTQLVQWTRNVESYILAASNQAAGFTIDQFPEAEQERIITKVAPFLRGRAAAWYNDVRAAGNMPRTWAEFTDALRKYFHPAPADANLHNALMNMRQLPGEAMHSYVGRFDRIYKSIKSEHRSEPMAMVMFSNGIASMEIKKNLAHQMAAGNEKCKTLSSFVQFAIELAMAYNSLHAQATNRAPHAHNKPRAPFARYHFSNASPSTSASSSSSQSVPMELGLMENDEEKGVTEHDEHVDVAAMQTHRPQMTEAQRREYMAKGMCFHCGKHGHISRACPNKPKPKNH